MTGRALQSAAETARRSDLERLVRLLRMATFPEAVELLELKLREAEQTAVVASLAKCTDILRRTAHGV